jgi:hypothetical protein
MFRRILSDGQMLVRGNNPRVVLSVEPRHQYSKALVDRLNYQERDDQLIGTVYEFASDNPTFEVRLLTHDTTPLYVAQSLNLATDVIPDEWLLPPENTESEKELAALKAENARLRKAEPYFEIEFLAGAETKAERYETSHTWFEPLSDDEIDVLMQRLTERFPVATDFGSREPVEREARIGALRGILGMKEEFVPATEEEIAKYRDEAYPGWLASCKVVLRNYHQTLQRQMSVPAFEFQAENRGTRPAADALITVEANGNFQIKPPTRDDHDDGDSDDDANRQETGAGRLPCPPAAPSGKWHTIKGGFPHNPFISLGSLSRTLQGIPAMPDYGRSILDRSFLQTPFPLPTKRDPNAFYYKPSRPQFPQDDFHLECDQWRHEDGEMTFPGEIYPPRDQELVEGALVFRIAAGNLSKSVSKLIPVRIIIAHVSASDRARALVEGLSVRSEIRFKGASET